LFAHDTSTGISTAADLVNTNARGVDALAEVADLDAFLDTHHFSGRRDGTREELRRVIRLRGRLRAAWQTPDVAQLAGFANQLMREAHAHPWLTFHDGWDWHLHVTEPDAPLVDRLAAEAGMALADLIRAGEHDRLKLCAAEDCDAVLVDLTRNRSRRFCDTGNCGNRQHVAAYRARRAAAAS
jgi:predicted RNA-binding Zn ribbon-like protein